MRIVLPMALAILLPATAVAQQPTSPAPTPTPVVVPPPVIPAPTDTVKPAAPADTSPAPVAVPATAPTAPAAGTATIRPGMTADQVEAAWGKPAVQRTVGTRTYLFYKNDCLRRCGTFDVVFLDGGQVVDAIVRASYHAYDGTSSSPPDRKPAFTKPGA